ncbi:MAG: hypothetical protein NUW22_12710, partial [Acidobacteria bacterium]|nr:hypothetical protein [Acidobacteriota bacterium]
PARAAVRRADVEVSRLMVPIQGIPSDRLPAGTLLIALPGGWFIPGCVAVVEDCRERGVIASGLRVSDGTDGHRGATYLDEELCLWEEFAYP